MGVDVKMYVEVPDTITPDRVLKVSRRMVDCFGADSFWWHDENDKYTRAMLAKGQTVPHALYLREPFERDDDGNYVSSKEQEGKLHVVVSTLGRYYGPGYERGPLHEYVAWAHYLKHHFPEGIVYYGSDSGDQYEAWTPSFEKMMLNHFHTHGHEPYRGGFNLGNKYKGGPKDCPRCLVPLIQSGFGQEYGGYFCNSCDHKIATYDGGKTYIDRNKKTEEAQKRFHEMLNYPENAALLKVYQDTKGYF